MSKPSLTRENYIDAALSVIAERGLDKLSMRNVATELGVSAMAAYKHFENKDDLLTAALDRFIVRANVIPPDELPWDQWMKSLGTAMYHALCGEMSWVPVLGAVPLGSIALSVTDAFIAKLIRAGFSRQQALNAMLAMVQTVIGAACLQASLQKDVANRPLKKVRASDSATAMAHEQIDIGLPFLIEALAAQRQRQDGVLS